MRYKIKSFFYTTFYLNNKKELFKFIKDQTKWNGFFSVFDDKFDVSFQSGFFVKYGKELKTEYCYQTEKQYVKALFIIKDEFGNTVNYAELYNEYRQSLKTKTKDYQRKYSYKDSSTSRYRKKMKAYNVDKQKNTYKREFSILSEDIEDCPKYRAKRMSDIKHSFVKTYDDVPFENKDFSNWKRKKVKHQWK